MDEKENYIKNRLKRLRLEQDLSQRELADELGISRQSIIALEQGKYMPSLPLVVSMCQFFNSTFENIFQIEKEIENEVNKVFVDKNINKDKRKETKMTELEPWRPFREAVSLRDAMDRLFEDSTIVPKSSSVMPKIDVKDKKNEIVVSAELPGINEEDVNVEICEGAVTISGEKSEEKKEKRDDYYYKESHSGSFSRSFSLPAEVDEDKVEAEMDKGVLTVKLPKIKPKKAKKVLLKPKKSK